MTKDETKKLAGHVMRLLKVRYVSLPVAQTEKGPVYLKYVKDQDDYEIVLDAVPLDMKEHDHKELKMLFEKYLFESEV